ncbi:MAG: hypothetical protein DMF65_14775 [Acidobacteria bacterium]|nr:MAG: hypothetical protein DMF65_14775 [Acidobacteriota bacterium]
MSRRVNDSPQPKIFSSCCNSKVAAVMRLRSLARRTKEKGMGVKYVAGSPMVCVRVKRWPALS